jgi:Protein of unknown function (DUF2786)
VMDKLTDRIRKLLALAGNNPSEAEAAAAMERASALMAEHNLTMAQINILGANREERTETQYEGQSVRQTWARSISDAVADLNFCFYCYRAPRRSGIAPRRTDIHFVVGTRANVESTKLMALYLVDTVERLARECAQTSGHEKHAFKLGCAHRLAERLRQLRDERIAAQKEAQQSPPTPTKTNLPTLAGVYETHEAANREFYAKLHKRMPRRRRGSGTTNWDVYQLGRIAGNDVGLNAQVKSQRRLAAR